MLAGLDGKSQDMTEIETFLGSCLLRGFCLDVFYLLLSKGLKLLCRVSTTLVTGNSVLGNSPFLPTDPNLLLESDR